MIKLAAGVNLQVEYTVLLLLLLEIVLFCDGYFATQISLFALQMRFLVKGTDGVAFIVDENASNAYTNRWKF